MLAAVYDLIAGEMLVFLPVCDFCVTDVLIEKLPKVKNGSPPISSLAFANCKPTALSPIIPLPDVTNWP